MSQATRGAAHGAQTQESEEPQRCQQQQQQHQRDVACAALLRIIHDWGLSAVLPAVLPAVNGPQADAHAAAAEALVDALTGKLAEVGGSLEQTQPVKPAGEQPGSLPPPAETPPVESPPLEAPPVEAPPSLCVSLRSELLVLVLQNGMRGGGEAGRRLVLRAVMRLCEGVAARLVRGRVSGSIPDGSGERGLAKEGHAAAAALLAGVIKALSCVDASAAGRAGPTRIGHAVSSQSSEGSGSGSAAVHEGGESARLWDNCQRRMDEVAAMIANTGELHILHPDLQELLRCVRV